MGTPLTEETARLLLAELRKYNSGKKESGQWVKASAVMEVTGWDRFQLRDARRSGLIKHRIKSADGRKQIWHDLGSLPEVYKKNTNDTTNIAAVSNGSLQEADGRRKGGR